MRSTEIAAPGRRAVYLFPGAGLYIKSSPSRRRAWPPPDKRSFVAELAARYGVRLRRFLLLHGSGGPDALDLSQEVFMRLMRVHNVDDIRNPEAYLFRVASNVLQEHVQKRASMPQMLESTELFSGLHRFPDDDATPEQRHLRELQSVLVSGDDPAAQVALQQRLRALQRALDELPPRVALTLVLHRLVGQSIEEIARELGIAVSTTKKYLAKALLHCRETCGTAEVP